MSNAHWLCDALCNACTKPQNQDIRGEINLGSICLAVEVALTFNIQIQYTSHAYNICVYNNIFKGEVLSISKEKITIFHFAGGKTIPLIEFCAE